MINFVKTFTACLLLMSGQALLGQSGIDISSIPDSLKRKADAVFLLDHGVVRVHHEQRVTFKVHQTVVILNEKGRDHALISVNYDKLISIKSLDALAMDANGKLLEKFRMKDFEDRSNISDYSLFEDDRVKVADLRQNKYPYVIELEYELEFQYLFHIPNWWFNTNEHTAVVKSRFELISPEHLSPRYKLLNGAPSPTSTSTDGLVNLVFELEHLTALEKEPFGPDLGLTCPTVMTSPSIINFEGHRGNMNTWEDYGFWQWGLNNGLDKLNEESIAQIKTVTDTIKSTEDKVKVVYTFVQNKTRYVSIQEGIGGYQPFSASMVSETGYGDCKALSNYTYSLLKSIGIESHYTKVYADNGSLPLYEDFPYNAFNHIILCVPLKRDTIWLECTSQTNPFGYLGSFTGDRDVMLVTPDGGKIVHTPEYTEKENTRITKARVRMNEINQVDLQVEVEYSGIQSEYRGLHHTISKGEKELKDWIYRNTRIPGLQVGAFDFALHGDRIPIIHETFSGIGSNLLSKSGDHFFVEPNLMNKWVNSPPKVPNRQTDLVLDESFTVIDSIEYLLPENLKIEFLPEAVSLTTTFGNYLASAQAKEHSLFYVRKLVWLKGNYPKETYEEFRKFYRSIIKADHSKVVFLANEI